MMMIMLLLQGDVVTKVARVQYSRVSIRETKKGSCDTVTEIIVVCRGWREPRGLLQYARI
jgi:hypothetical protein